MYDDKGRRLSTTVSGVTTYFHYNDNNNKVIYETDAANNITAEYTWDSLGNPVTFIKNGVTYYYHLNAHGDTIGLTNSNRDIVATYEYDAWGNVTGQLGTMASANTYRYAGYRYDEYTGLYYLMARYYDANIGRFINADNASSVKGLIDEFLRNPAQFKTALTFMPNIYLYCANNPTNYTDSFGHLWNFSQPWNSVNNIGFTIDVAIFVIGLAVGIVGATGAIKDILRRNAKGLIVRATRQALLKARLSALPGL